MITPGQYLQFVTRALDGMVAIVAELGDDLANDAPAVPGANSPYALLTHCLGVVSYWSGELVAGRPAARDRAAEFDAAGPVAPLLDEARRTLARLADDVATAVPRAALRATPRPDFLGPPPPLDQGAALLHVYEELVQHYGQMQVIRDCITAGPR